MSLMFSKSRGTIGWKLMLLATISVTLALLLTCSVFAAYGIQSLQTAKWEQLRSQGSLLALNSAAAVEFEDAVQADRLLAALRAEPSVTSAALFSADGRMVGSYPDRQQAEAAFEQNTGRAAGQQFLDHDVLSDSETVGRLRMLVDFTSVRIAMWNYALLTMVVGLGSWAVAICAAFVLQRGIVRPVDHLAHVARRVADDGNYAVRAEGQVTGELADLYRAFNGMLTQIQTSKQQLQDANDNLERRVTERTEELAHALDSAQAASRAKSEFLANMSHEIRTPLNAIMGYADLLRRGWVESPEERDEMLTTVHTSGRHLMTILNDILDLSKIESGRLELEIRSESPHQVLSEVVSLMRVSFREKSLNLDYTWQGAIPRQIKTDTVRLRQVLINLLGNARKFTTSGGVQMIARLEGTGDTRRMLIEVIDTGVGIPLDKQSQIFEPFVQADNSVTRKFGGTGLGLSISRRLARMLGGDLIVTSEPGKGSNFQLSIAIGDVDESSIVASSVAGDVIPAPKTTSAQVQLPPILKGMRVLVVDDGFANRKLISLVLSRSGAEMTEAENGQEACDRVLSCRPFDVILMDMQMPIMDGYAATAKLRESGVTVPIIALTAHAMKGDREKCLNAGCSDFLSKPVGTDELLAKMGTIFGPRCQPAPSASTQQPILSKLPTDDIEFAEIVVDFVAALKREIARLSHAVKTCDPVNTLHAAHWIKGSGGTAGFPCFSAPCVQICDAVRKGTWADIDRHVLAIMDYSDRIQVPVVASKPVIDEHLVEV